MATDSELFKPQRIDHFFNTLADLKDDSNKERFPSIVKVARASLTCSNGNAIAERGFSYNKLVLEEQRLSLKEVTIARIRLVMDYIYRKYEGDASKIPRTKALIKCLTEASQAYKDEQLRQREESERKRKEEMDSAERNKIVAEKKAKKEKVDALEKIVDDAKLEYKAATDIEEMGMKQFQAALATKGKSVSKDTLLIAQAKIAEGQRMREQAKMKQDDAMKKLKDLKS